MTAVVVPLNLDEQQQRAYEEQAARAVEGRAKNIEYFTKLFLAMGRDVIAANTMTHRLEMEEALAAAAGQWSRLLDLEAQAEREAALLASRGKRPADPLDWRLPESAIARLDGEWQAETAARKAELDRLKKQAAAERKALEALVTTKKG
jgi:hypothetical protein